MLTASLIVELPRGVIGSGLPLSSSHGQRYIRSIDLSTPLIYVISLYHYKTLLGLSNDLCLVGRIISYACADLGSEKEYLISQPQRYTS